MSPHIGRVDRICHLILGEWLEYVTSLGEWLEYVTSLGEWLEYVTSYWVSG